MARRRLTAGYQDQPRGEPSEVTAGYQDRAEQPATPEVYNLSSADSDDEGKSIARSELPCPTLAVAEGCSAEDAQQMIQHPLLPPDINNNPPYQERVRKRGIESSRPAWTTRCPEPDLGRIGKLQLLLLG